MCVIYRGSTLRTNNLQIILRYMYYSMMGHAYGNTCTTKKGECPLNYLEREDKFKNIIKEWKYIKTYNFILALKSIIFRKVIK